ncbi:MAG: hypothetical protein IPG05_07430 [Gemmatimonadetes bacterium]|nr:hypothetical protein [Gemmatimonadota bacterium]
MSDRHRISLADAIAMVQQARKTAPTMVNGWNIDAAIIREILSQPGAAGRRAYMASTAEGVATLVYLAVDKDGKDMTDGVIAEYAFPCPPDCDASSPFSAA